MGFGDIFKKSFLQEYSNNGMSIQNIFFSLFMTAVIGAGMFIIYRMVTRKAFYSKNFNISLVSLALITCGIIITIQTNVVISLGMVGALSIVRFRTAIKEPLDLVFLFWAISVGIICGASQYIVAVVLSFMVTLSLMLLEFIPMIKEQKILVINLSNTNTKEIFEILKKYTKTFKVKSQNIKDGRLDMLIEIKVTKHEELINCLSALKNTESVSLISQEGEITL